MLKSIACNHCVKLVLTANLAFYWAGYSTKCNKDTSNCVSRMFKNLLTTVTENEIERKLNHPNQKSYYKQGLSTFNKASNNFEINSTVGTSMASYCILEGGRFQYSQKFVPIIPYQSLQYITNQPVTAVVDSKRNVKLSTTNYIFRHNSLENVNQYDFVQSFEVCTKSKLPKGRTKIIYKMMLDNEGIYQNGKYLMLRDDSKNYLTHFIKPRSKKVTPNIFWTRPSDMRRLDFPSNQMYGKIYRKAEILGEPYPADKLKKKREHFAQNMLILFYPFRNLESFRVSETIGWWDALIRIRDLGHFSAKAIFHMSNIQSWNDTFLSKSDSTFLGEETDSDSSDIEENTEMNFATGIIDGQNLFDDEIKQESLMIIKKNDFLNPKTIDHNLLRKLNESGQTFLQKNIKKFPDLDSLNEKKSYEYIESDKQNIDNDDEKEQNQSHLLSKMSEDDTLVYILNMNDAQRGINDYVPPKHVKNVPNYDERQPSISELATIHGLSIKQFSAFSILCQKQLLNVYRTNERILTPDQKNIKKLLETFFTKKPLYALLIGPAGTGKTRVLNCFFHWMVLWGLKDRNSVNSTTGVSANLLSTYLGANTWYHGLGLSLNTKNDHCIPKRLEGLCDKLWILCIDEISMLSIQEFHRLSKRLKQLTQNQNKFMGNIDILFSGDFFQLKSQGTPLYNRINENKETKYDKHILQASKDYFNHFTMCFYFEKVYRSEPAFTKILNNFRVCQPTVEDIKNINSRVISKKLLAPTDCTIIVPTNIMRTTINTKCFWTHVEHKWENSNHTNSFISLGYIIIDCDVTTSVDETATTIQKISIRKYLRNMEEKYLGKMCGHLKVFIGCPMMTTTNVDVSKGISNGTLFTLSKIIFKHIDKIKYPKTTVGIVIPTTKASNIDFLVLKHLPGPFEEKEMIKNLPGYITVPGRKSRMPSIPWNENIKTINATITQFPCVPAFSLTGHKTQGATLLNVLIASYSGHSTGKDGWLYVVISRIKSLKNLFTVDELKTDIRHYKPREDVIIEDTRIKEKANRLYLRAKLFWEQNKDYMDNL